MTLRFRCICICTLLQVRMLIAFSTLRRCDVAIFESTNVHVVHTDPSSFPWETLAPPSQEQSFTSNFFNWFNSQIEKKASYTGTLGLDRYVEFSEPAQGAQFLVDQIKELGYPISVTERDFIANVFTIFQNTFTSSYLMADNKSQRFKARLVSSRGPIGQKCPRWHVDNVPFRLVLALAGPGCMYIPLHNEYNKASVLNRVMVDRDALNNLDEEDSEKANTLILPHGEDQVAINAQTGDAVIMMGRALEDKDDEFECFHFIERPIKALVHKSPIIRTDEARVLLTVDLLYPNIL